MWKLCSLGEGGGADEHKYKEDKKVFFLRKHCKICSLGEGGGAEDDEEREEAALSAWPRPSRRRGRGTERANSPSFGFKFYTTEY